MQGMPDVMKLYSQALESAGTSSRKFDLYQQSTQAHLDELKNSVQTLFTNALSSDLINKSIDTLTGLVKIIDELSSKGALLPALFGTIGVSLFALNENFRKSAMSGTFLTAMFDGMVISIDAVKVALRGLLFASVVGAAFAGLGLVLEKIIGYFTDTSSSSTNLTKSLEDNYQEVTLLSDKYKSLTKELDNNQVSSEQLAAKKQELASVTQQLAKLIPGVVSQWNNEGEAISINIQKLDDYKKKYAEVYLFTTQNDLNANLAKKKEIEQEIERQKVIFANMGENDLSLFDKITGKTADDYRQDAGKKIEDLNNQLQTVDAEIKKQQSLLDAINGKSNNSVDDSIVDNRTSRIRPAANPFMPMGHDEAVKKLQSDLEDFKHYVNMQESGYKTAEEQAQKLREIRKKYASVLSDKDLYGIDEEIYRADNDIALKAKGFSSSSATSPYDDTDKYDIVNPYERQIKSVDAALKESQSKQNNYEDTSKEFRDELSKQIDLYKQKQELVHQEAEELRASNEALINRLNTEKLSQKQRNDLLKQLDDNKNKISDLSAQWFDYEKSATDANRKITESLKKEVDDRFDFSKNWIEEQKALSKLSLQEELDAWKRVVQNHKDDENDLAQIREENAKKHIDAEKEIARVQEEINKQREETEKKYADNIKEVAKTIWEAEKKAMEAQRDAELRGIDDLINAEEKRHKQRQDNLDEEMSKFQESIDLVTQSIDRQSAADDYNASLTKQQKEAQDTQNLINQYKLDNSIESQAKVKELEQKLADQLEAIEKLKADRTKQIRKDSLQDLLDKKKKEIDAAKKAEDTQYNNTKEMLDKQKQAREDYWKGVIDNDSKYLQLQTDLINGNFGKISAEMEGFKTDITSKASIIGESIKQNIIDMLARAQQTMSNFQQNPYGSSDNNFSSTPSSGNGKYVPANSEEQRIVGLMKQNSDAWNKTTDQATRYNLEYANRQYGSQIGATYKNGTWYKNGLPLYHEGGEVGVQGTSFSKWLAGLGSNEIGAILKKTEVVMNNPIQNIAQIISKFMPDFSKIQPRVATVGGGDTHYHLDINIDKLLGGKEGAQTLFTEIKKGLQTKRF
jgi:hypothetical protein